MRIAYVQPWCGPCGGPRIIAEHVSRLEKRGHHSVLLIPGQTKMPDWLEIQAHCMLPEVAASLDPFDAVVATGWQTPEMAMAIPAKRRYYFVQMQEYMFFHTGMQEYSAALRSYPFARDNGFTFLTISKWQQEVMKTRWGIDSHLVRIGVNQNHFYPDGAKRRAILLEGDARNPAKDVDHLMWRAGLELRKEFGVKLWGFASTTNPFIGEFDQFTLQPSVAQMRQFYSGALFLMKASKYEGRPGAVNEAMACGTPSVVAIAKGDDDLIDGYNCLKSSYSYDEFLAAARKPLLDDALLASLARGAREYHARYLQWGPIITRLEEIYSGAPL